VVSFNLGHPLKNIQFLADCTNGRALALMLQCCVRLSPPPSSSVVCNVVYCG